MDLKSTYNKIAEDWFKDHKDDDLWWVEGADKFVSLLSRNGLVLDVGCGAGIKTSYLVKNGFKVIGIDFSEKMIEISKKRVPAGKFLVMDVKDLSGLKENFNGIFAQAILLHFSKVEVKNILQNWISKLKSGGYLYIAVKEIKAHQKEEAIVKENDYGFEYERFFSYFTMEEIENYFKELNLKICYKNIAKFGSTNWIQIMGQKV
jgi:SAM-dependent methyltransferase